MKNKIQIHVSRSNSSPIINYFSTTNHYYKNESRNNYNNSSTLTSKSFCEICSIEKENQTKKHDTNDPKDVRNDPRKKNPRDRDQPRSIPPFRSTTTSRNWKGPDARTRMLCSRSRIVPPGGDSEEKEAGRRW